MHISWQQFIDEEMDKDYFIHIKDFLLKIENEGVQYYPEPKNILNVFAQDLASIKVVILGQDPYHNPNQAHGYSFSVLDGIKPPPSLKNIYKEINSEFNISNNMENGNLTPWVNQGVFLLNSILTVEKSKPASHKKIGWDVFTDRVIRKISEDNEHVVFLLWGSFAKSKKVLIESSKHLVLESPHPSGFSAHKGFFGNNHFKSCNEYLSLYGKTPIDWQIK